MRQRDITGSFKGRRPCRTAWLRWSVSSLLDDADLIAGKVIKIHAGRDHIDLDL
jgi:hypothetical protein